jgi:hypothetical protein
VAVNVLSRQHPSELLYLADEAFSHPVVQDLPALPDGFTPLPSKPGEEALDYIRANLFDRQLLRPVPPPHPGPTTTSPTSSTTTSNAPPPTPPPGCTPSGSGGDPSPPATRSSASLPATASTTST